MAEKKERSPAQRAADARYAAKNPNRNKALQFMFSAAEAEEIDQIIAETGLTKADFLRRAVKAHQDNKF